MSAEVLTKIQMCVCVCVCTRLSLVHIEDTSYVFDEQSEDRIMEQVQCRICLRVKTFKVKGHVKHLL